MYDSCTTRRSPLETLFDIYPWFNFENQLIGNWMHLFICMTRARPMGWLRLVGSLKSYVSFAEYRLFDRALLQKSPILLRFLATPYQAPCLIHICSYIYWYIYMYAWQNSSLLLDMHFSPHICMTKWLAHGPHGPTYTWHGAQLLLDMHYFFFIFFFRERRIHVRDTPRWDAWHDPFICVTWHIDMCDITHSYVWRVSFICVKWLIHIYDTTHSHVWRESSIYVAWLIHICDMTHSYMWHDSFICVTWLIHMCDMTHSYVWHYSFKCVTLLIQMCDASHHPNV